MTRHLFIFVCLFFFFSSFHFLQSQITTAWWTRSEIFLTTCRGPSARLSSSCSLRSFTFHVIKKNLWTSVYSLWLLLVAAAFVQEPRDSTSGRGAFQDAAPLPLFLFWPCHPSEGTCRRHPGAQDSPWLDGDCWERRWGLWLGWNPSVSSQSPHFCSDQLES